MSVLIITHRNTAAQTKAIRRRTVIALKGRAYDVFIKLSVLAGAAGHVPIGELYSGVMAARATKEVRSNG